MGRESRKASLAVSQARQTPLLAYKSMVTALFLPITFPTSSKCLAQRSRLKNTPWLAGRPVDGWEETVPTGMRTGREDWVVVCADGMTTNHVPVQPHLVAGLHIAGSGSHGERCGTLHHCVGGLQWAQ